MSGVVEGWRDGGMEYWSIGGMEYWRDGTVYGVLALAAGCCLWKAAGRASSPQPSPPEEERGKHPHIVWETFLSPAAFGNSRESLWDCSLSTAPFPAIRICFGLRPSHFGSPAVANRRWRRYSQIFMEEPQELSHDTNPISSSSAFICVICGQPLWHSNRR